MLLMATNATELFKVTQLVRHFSQHAQADPGLSFIDFLQEHYSNVPHTDNDDSEDQKLPFKTPVHTAGAIAFWSVPQTGVPVKAPVYAPRPAPGYRVSYRVSPPSDTIWQPPKNA